MSSHKNKYNSKNKLPNFSQQLFLRTGRSIELMARFIKELGTDPDIQEVADEIPSLHRLLKLWTDPSALLADSAPDVEAIQAKMKKLEQVHQAYATKLETERQQKTQLEAKNAAKIDQLQVYKDLLTKLKKEKQAETNQFQQQIKKLEEEKSQLSSQLQKVYQVLGVPNPGNQLVSEPKSSQKSTQDTTKEKEHKDQSASSSVNAETTGTNTSKRKPSVEDLTTPPSSKKSRSAGLSTTISSTKSSSSTQLGKQKKSRSPSQPREPRIITRVTQPPKKKNIVGPSKSEQDIQKMLELLKSSKTVIFPQAFQPDYTRHHCIPDGFSKANMSVPEYDNLLKKCEVISARLSQEQYNGAQMSEFFFPTKKAHYQKQADNAQVLTIEILQQWIKLREPDRWYAHRPQFIRMVDPAELSFNAREWLFGVLEFQCAYRWELYLKMFSFPISERKLHGHFWDQFRRFMKTRRDKCRDVHMYLRQTAEELIKTKELPPYIWLDPVVIPLTSPCYLYPLDHRDEAEEAGYTPDFLGIMKYEEENMHHRTFWFFNPSDHPFYQLELDDSFVCEYALPWSPVVEPLDSPFIEPGFAAFLESHPRVPSYSSFFSFDIALRMNFTRGDYGDLIKRLLPPRPSEEEGETQNATISTQEIQPITAPNVEVDPPDVNTGSMVVHQASSAESSEIVSTSQNLSTANEPNENTSSPTE